MHADHCDRASHSQGCDPDGLVWTWFSRPCGRLNDVGALPTFLRVLRWGLILVLLLVAGFVAWYYEPDPGEDAPRVLVSIDRTLWNRVRLNRLTYVRALRKAGMRPVLIDFDSLPEHFDPYASLESFDGLLISGGGDVAAERYGGDNRLTLGVNPARDELELALLDAADRSGMPTLGLCRGAQLLNVHRGGTLGDFREDSARYKRHKRIWGGHPVSIEEGSRLAEILGTDHLPAIVTWHGQYVEQPGDEYGSRRTRPTAPPKRSRSTARMRSA